MADLLLQATTANSGNPVESHFCGRCGTTLWHEGPATQGLAFVKAGVIVQKEAVNELEPVAEIFTKRRANWLGVVEGAHQKEEME